MNNKTFRVIVQSRRSANDFRNSTSICPANDNYLNYP